MDMTKFEDASDPGFIAVVGELRRWVRELEALSKTQVAAATIPQQQQEEQQQDGLCTYTRP
jgi:hypothetical protein